MSYLIAYAAMILLLGWLHVEIFRRILFFINARDGVSLRLSIFQELLLAPATVFIIYLGLRYLKLIL